MNETIEQKRYRGVFETEEALKIFTRNMQDFDNEFCKLMFSRKDFILKMEVRGNNGKLVHVKIDPQSWDRPRGNGDGPGK